MPRPISQEDYLFEVWAGLGTTIEAGAHKDRIEFNRWLADNQTALTLQTTGQESYDLAQSMGRRSLELAKAKRKAKE